MVNKSTLVLLLFAGCTVASVQSFSPPTGNSISGRTAAEGTTTTSTNSNFSTKSTVATSHYSPGCGPRNSLSVPFIAGRLFHRQHASVGAGGPLSMAATTSSSGASSSSASVEYPPASDGEALQSLFSMHCNDEGLMTEKEMRNVPAIKDMLVCCTAYFGV